MAKERILLVDDDKEALTIYQRYLKKKGYEVETCSSAEEALSCLKDSRADCIVLDVMMPGEDGFQVLPKIRSLSEAPVIYLSGKAEAEDRIKGLSLGADDYVTKPCSLEELSLRIGIQIRKKTVEESRKDVLEIPPLMIRRLERKVFCGSEEVLLSNREYELLLLLAQNPGRTLTFEEIGKAINGNYLLSDRQAVMMTASRLRKKLEQFAGVRGLIETVWGEGYRLKQ